MPRLLRAAGAVGVAVGAWKLWKRLPAARQKQVLAQARKHGPAAAKTALRLARRR